MFCKAIYRYQSIDQLTEQSTGWGGAAVNKHSSYLSDRSSILNHQLVVYEHPLRIEIREESIPALWYLRWWWWRSVMANLPNFLYLLHLLQTESGRVTSAMENELNGQLATPPEWSQYSKGKTKIDEEEIDLTHRDAQDRRSTLQNLILPVRTKWASGQNLGQLPCNRLATGLANCYVYRSYWQMSSTQFLYTIEQSDEFWIELDSENSRRKWKVTTCDELIFLNDYIIFLTNEIEIN